ncbi:MAG: hypothetical protein QOJ61_2821 [Mycobacterium sp.]|nr:hypothetical protein [Mycobacterium sp.]
MRRIRDIADLGMPLLDQSRTRSQRTVAARIVGALVPDCPSPQRAVAARIVGALVPDCPSPQRAVAARIVGALGGFEIVG